MKKTKMLRRIITVALTAAALLAIAVYADSSVDSYETQNDPLISKSYLTLVFKPELEEYINGAAASKVSEMMKTFENDAMKPYVDRRLEEYATLSLLPYINEKIDEKLSELSGAGYAMASKKIAVAKGEILYAEDVCEIVLRSGKAFVVCDEGDLGAADTTGGVELTNGDSVTLNHNVMFSSDNNCGVRAVSDLTVFVKGAFRIAKP
ncbi:MAG: hypothetical protein J5940_07150 [Clostridia bacterium]|nr:hypothetical protein [Clostridia bacterium]